MSSACTQQSYQLIDSCGRPMQQGQMHAYIGYSMAGLSHNTFSGKLGLGVPVTWGMKILKQEAQLSQRGCVMLRVIELLLSHSRSLNIKPFDRSYTSPYWHSIVTMALSCTISKIKHDISQKS